MIARKHILVALALVICSTGSCSNPDTSISPTTNQKEGAVSNDLDEGLLPRGRFLDDYNSRHQITIDSWTQDSTYRYVFLHDEDQMVVVRNDSMNPSESGLYSRIDWIWLPDNSPYTWAYCLSAYDASSEAEARAASAADGTTPMTGCNGFPFTRMQPIELSN